MTVPKIAEKVHINILTKSILEEGHPPKEGSVIFYEFKKRWWIRPISHCAIILYDNKKNDWYVYLSKDINMLPCKVQFDYFLRTELKEWTKYDHHQYNFKNGIMLWQPVVQIPECRLRLIRERAESMLYSQTLRTDVHFTANILNAAGLNCGCNNSFLQCNSLSELYYCLLSCGY